MRNFAKKPTLVTQEDVRLFLIFWLPPWLWMSLLLFFSGDLGSSKTSLSIIRWLLSWIPGLTSRDILTIHNVFRKLVGHLGAYAVLYVLWFRALRGHLAWRSLPALLTAMFLCLGVALMDEGHQMLLTSRQGSFWDVGLDMVGVSLSAVPCWFFWAMPASPGYTRVEK